MSKNRSESNPEGVTSYSFPALETRFAKDVAAGLSQFPKKLPCVYFYDRNGSRMFEKICRQPEYYCTRAETEILDRHSIDIAASCANPARIVELGSGSSVKTRILLDAFIGANKQISYYPIDVSPEILKESSAFLDRTYPSLNVEPIIASYEVGLDKLNISEGTTLLIWLGSSIGNFEPKSAITFLQQNCSRLKAGDRILLGIDLIKDPKVLQAAYNDRAGITSAFNLNLLARINRELGGDFRLEQFEHRAVFNSEKERIEMYLASKCEQRAYLEAINLHVHFNRGESIHTENSYKYSTEGIRKLGESAGLKLLHQWFDSKKRFSLNLFETRHCP